jgi:hypothetical protein
MISNSHRLNATTQSAGRPYSKVSRAKQSSLVRKLKSPLSCEVCTVKFAHRRREGGDFRICFKTQCNYVDSLKQRDAWNAKCERLRVRYEKECGYVVPRTLAGAVTWTPPASSSSSSSSCPVVVEDDDDVEDIVVAEGVVGVGGDAVFVCPIDGCTARLSLDTISHIESKLSSTTCEPLHQMASTFMASDGSSVGWCALCFKHRRSNYYFCDRHHLMHERHVDDLLVDQAKYYASNDPESVKVPKNPVRSRVTVGPLVAPKAVMPSIPTAAPRQEPLPPSQYVPPSKYVLTLPAFIPSTNDSFTPFGSPSDGLPDWGALPGIPSSDPSLGLDYDKFQFNSMEDDIGFSLNSLDLDNDGNIDFNVNSLLDRDNFFV